ncbi:carboxynorspermidine decarboxylase [Desulfovibrio sp. OttesenSCG-928-C06]|nr:carboxynorspermidine decarboxylase [Desulfovibrio sp. OttesenSCG-928-C06]
MSINVSPWLDILPPDLPTPCFVVDEDRLLANLEILDSVQERTGAKILLALKGFAMFSTFPLLKKVLHGACASSPHEARLAREEFGREVHTFAAGYSDEDMREILQVSDHVVFNSFAQLERFAPLVKAAGEAANGVAGNVSSGSAQCGRNCKVEIGLRVNPEHSEGATPIYDPCSPGSRLGIRLADFAGRSAQDLLDLGVSGLHFHTLCEQDAAPLARTLAVVEEKFGHYLPHLKWINFGGGHHITRPGYDLDLLCSCIERVRAKYGLNVYVEPGEAVALNTGVLVSTVLDVVQADMPVAILDTSAAAHMPDVLEMPYRPGVIDSGEAGEKAWTCRLAGKSCLAGDVIGEYSFDEPLNPGDRLVFLDMAHYSMVKTNTFNGLGLPGIALLKAGTHEFRMVRSFGYEDFRMRLS